MVTLAIYPIHSLLSHQELISSDSKKLLDNLKAKTGYDFKITTDFAELQAAPLALILVQSGGSEGVFKKEIYPKFKGPYYLLTYGASNSLAASLEILTFLKEKSKKAEILHGDEDYIASRIQDLLAKASSVKEPAHRLGLFGKPSDWLIGSDVDPKKALAVFNIKLVDVTEAELIRTVQEETDSCPAGLFKATFDPGELNKAYQIDLALEKLVAKYRLEGFTIRCFDVIKAVRMSACLGLAVENSKGIIASCEGDVPAMITAYSILKVLGQHAFQANPQWVDPVKNRIALAHCTLPLDMPSDYHFDTHFESGIGLGIHGNLRPGECTIVKVSPDLSEFYCEEGMILDNEERADRCRSQINVQLSSPATYFLTSSLGNHHQVIYGHHKAELKAYFQSLGLREIVG